MKDETKRLDQAQRMITFASYQDFTEERVFPSAFRLARFSAFIMLDIDHFKNINDRWGHDCGDLVIQNVADTLVRCTRDSDVIGRLGGEEFGVFLPDTCIQTAVQLAERIRTSIETLEIRYGDQIIRVSASLGVSSAVLAPSGLDALIKQGDECLYQAKQSGRNKVVHHQN